MKLSAYEIFLPLVGTDEKQIAGYALLVNGLYGAVDVVPQEDADKLRAGDFSSSIHRRHTHKSRHRALPECPCQ